ncbi:ClpXP adapter SpxH family protein [Flavobacterium wongokense]|uniref:ClpXP adapter SpxH family protein n=1 Tax=Flavobacterium wongokense TaxID=2910674 RepID=UPI001F225184|nr:ClpXP adapter SpxH family protein [Flavobacterium sp. WG47]MCF6133146.1 DsbA family protein [Flavobacterium sp. WG47]
MKQENNNPLLCNPEIGVCEMPLNDDVQKKEATITTEKTIKIVYFTDPICSSCWGIEPQLRKLKLEYGTNFEIEYRMGGLLKDWSYNSGGISKPSDVAHHWDEVSKYYGMPIVGDVWMEDPLSSSYPPSIAFKAAELQSKEKAILFLRRIREMVFLEKKNIAKWEHLQQAAIEVGLNPDKLKLDYEGKAQDLFYEDLALARDYGVRGFPTFFFSNSNEQLVLNGFKQYEVFEDTLLQLNPNAKKTTTDTDYKSLFAHYPTLTTKEFATLSNVSFIEAETILSKLASSDKLKRMTTKNGSIWQLAQR